MHTLRDVLALGLAQAHAAVKDFERAEQLGGLAHPNSTEAKRLLSTIQQRNVEALLVCFFSDKAGIAPLQQKA